MPLSRVLTDFENRVKQCEKLISNAHHQDSSGIFLLPLIDRQQITSASFLNLFIAWETFLEATLLEFMTGRSTVSGKMPTRYIVPANKTAAADMVTGFRGQYFDYGNHEYFKKLMRLFFQNGYPFDPHFGVIYPILGDARIIRNACAHISSSTQTKLEDLALRLTGARHPSITVYDLLMMDIPRSAPRITFFENFKGQLLAVAVLIVTG